MVGLYVATDSFAGRSLCSNRLSGLVGRYVATGSFADRSLRGDIVRILFQCSMNVFLGYACLVSMNEPRLVQYFTARFFVKVTFTKNTFIKTFMLIFTDIWMLTSSCPFLIPTHVLCYFHKLTIHELLQLCPSKRWFIVIRSDQHLLGPTIFMLLQLGYLLHKMALTSLEFSKSETIVPCCSPNLDMHLFLPYDLKIA